MDEYGKELKDLDSHDMRSLARSIIYTGLRPCYKKDEKMVECLSRALKKCALMSEES